MGTKQDPAREQAGGYGDGLPQGRGGSAGVCSSLLSPRTAPTCPALPLPQDPSPRTPEQLIPISTNQTGDSTEDGDSEEGSAPGLPGDPPRAPWAGRAEARPWLRSKVGVPAAARGLQIYNSEKSEAGCVEKGEEGDFY